MKRRTKFLILLLSFLVWLTVFLIHGYMQVKRLTGQCCGYEGDPGFLTLFFLIFPGVFYFIGLIMIIAFEIAVLFIRDKQPPR